MAKVPKPLSLGEESFAFHCKLYKLTPEREYQFCDRLWRLDFAWPDKMVAAEIDGGTRGNGRHNRHEGYTGDCYKINQATLMGWRVYRFTTEMVKDATAIDTIRKALQV
jgi:very-short-patch-repair endonuclease